MKKISNSLVLTCAVFSLSCILTSVYACSQDTAGFLTGGACSVKELKNLEKTNVLQKRKNFLPSGERNLRPVRQVPGVAKSDDDDCLFGMCLYKKILELGSK